ncbi:prepilin-type N-terminal cleavage/methylation domain-containing protein [Sphingomonas sp. J344]|uniref:PulJ/GspJ family protein n=1 Tax=Sphingomonas sp. J344 TaxID=2898434 RepID=UPI0021514A29|nr:prepilin-type N-terminal cleavage/methylation domain-containing protein [Sphingomonas sp. J344]MCR5872367.1 prepilin-type N-terminal cleavage/methylation domain-containing protein [Sphingomonas sp. J344]
MNAPMPSPRRRPGPLEASQDDPSGGPGLRRGDDGFTLLELIISLGLFALIAVAGLTLLNSVMTTQERTEGRLDRTAAIQRTMFVLQSDLDQITRGAVSGGGAMSPLRVSLREWAGRRCRCAMPRPGAPWSVPRRSRSCC